MNDPIPEVAAVTDPRLAKVGELAPAVVVAGGPYDLDQPGERAVVVTLPTNVRHAGRATLRSTVRALLAFGALLPILVSTAGLPVKYAGYFVVPVAIAAGLTRVMALPQVEAFLQTFVPWLAAAPSTNVLETPQPPAQPPA